MYQCFALLREFVGRIMAASCGEVSDLYVGGCVAVLLCLCVVASLQRVCGRGVHREGGTW